MRLKRYAEMNPDAKIEVVTMTQDAIASPDGFMAYKTDVNQIGDRM